MKARNLETESIALFSPFRYFPSIRSNLLLLARARAKLRNKISRWNVRGWQTGGRAGSRISRRRCRVSRSKIAKEIRKVEQSTGGKEGRMEKVEENYLEKTMNHFVLPFLYEAMLVKRQDSHLLSFRRGVGGKTWRSRSVWWNRWSIMLEEVWNEISSPLLLFWFEIVCWNRFRSFFSVWWGRNRWSIRLENVWNEISLLFFLLRFFSLLFEIVWDLFKLFLVFEWEWNR